EAAWDFYDYGTWLGIRIYNWKNIAIVIMIGLSLLFAGHSMTTLGLVVLTALCGVLIIIEGSWQARLLVVVCAALLSIPVTLILAPISLVVGPEMALAGLALQVTAEAIPPGQWILINITADESGDERVDAEQGTALQHSALYQDDKALRIIGNWLFDRRVEFVLENATTKQEPDELRPPLDEGHRLKKKPAEFFVRPSALF